MPFQQVGKNKETLSREKVPSRLPRRALQHKRRYQWCLIVRCSYQPTKHQPKNNSQGENYFNLGKHLDIYFCKFLWVLVAKLGRASWGAAWGQIMRRLCDVSVCTIMRRERLHDSVQRCETLKRFLRGISITLSWHLKGA